MIFIINLSSEPGIDCLAQNRGGGLGHLRLGLPLSGTIHKLSGLMPKPRYVGKVLICLICLKGRNRKRRKRAAEARRVERRSEEFMKFLKEGARRVCTGEMKVLKPTSRPRRSRWVFGVAWLRTDGHFPHHSRPLLRGQSPTAAFSQSSSMYQVSYRFPCLGPIFH